MGYNSNSKTSGFRAAEESLVIKLRGLKAWFLISGCIGIIVAVVLALVASGRSLNPMLILTIWPSSIAGIADPTTFSDKLLVGTYEFAGQFLLYGVIGTVLGVAFQLATHVTTRSNH